MNDFKEITKLMLPDIENQGAALYIIRKEKEKRDKEAEEKARLEKEAEAIKASKKAKKLGIAVPEVQEETEESKEEDKGPSIVNEKGTFKMDLLKS